MYSPKIYEELIPDLYRIAKGNNITMTRLVNTIIERALKSEHGYISDRFLIETIAEGRE